MKNELPEIKYDEFSERLFKTNARLPIEGSLELTYRCNLDCVHCYCNDPSLKRKNEELTFEELCRIMDNLADEGCLWIALTGGEPLIRDDFFDLYLYAKRKGFFVTILTNGALIDEKNIAFFKKWPPREVEISLYGLTEETHEKITGLKGSFRDTLRAIRLLKENQIKIEIKTIVLTVNRREIKAIRDFAADLPAPFRYDPLIHCRLNGDKSPHRFRLTARETVDLDTELGEMQPYWQKQCHQYRNAAIDCEKLYICGAGQNSFNINPYGQLQPCPFPGKYSYDLRKGTFNEGWRDFIPQMFGRKRLRRDFKCRDCVVHAFCNQCPEWAYLENNDDESIVDYICAIFKERHLRFGGIPADNKVLLR